VDFPRIPLGSHDLQVIDPMLARHQNEAPKDHIVLHQSTIQLCTKEDDTSIRSDTNHAISPRKMPVGKPNRTRNIEIIWRAIPSIFIFQDKKHLAWTFYEL
jgi:hypothetical protein